MKALKYYVYITWKNPQPGVSEGTYRLFFSFAPAFDHKYHREKGYDNLEVLTPALSLSKACYLWQRLTTAEERKEKVLAPEGEGRGLAGLFSFIRPKVSLKGIIRQKREATGKFLKGNLYPNKPVDPDLNRPQVLTLERENFAPATYAERALQLQQLLAGRILLPSELEKLLLEKGQCYVPEMDYALQLLALKGKLQLLPAVGQDKEGPICNRCGQRSKLYSIDCLSCQGECYLCEECLAMGEAKSCLPLLAVAEPPKEAKAKQLPVKLELNFQLTPAQLEASSKVTDFYRKARQGICLVWAVCGAGKTEVSFGAIKEALARGEKVLFAIPRRDVVLELEPRIKRAFPETSVVALYGGSSSKYQSADITIATTHQVLRFYQKFSLIVLDEADAYPYQGSQMLYYGLKRALAAGGKIIYMTATPNRELQRAVKRGELAKVTISARHHGYPLPVPKTLLLPSLKQDRFRGSNPPQIPRQLLEYLHRVVEGDKAQVFIFVPTVTLSETVGKALRKALSQAPYNIQEQWLQYSHAKDPQRDEKRQNFKAGLFPLFVTTSIMERGITVPRSRVLVLFADYERIYDEGTLVQMAGRSGRLASDPVGEVIFASASKSDSMVEASEAIKKMNLEALQKGYLRC